MTLYSDYCCLWLSDILEIVVYDQISNTSSISWRVQVTFDEMTMMPTSY